MRHCPGPVRPGWCLCWPLTRFGRTVSGAVAAPRTGVACFPDAGTFGPIVGSLLSLAAEIFLCRWNGGSGCLLGLIIFCIPFVKLHPHSVRHTEPYQALQFLGPGSVQRSAGWKVSFSLELLVLLHPIRGPIRDWTFGGQLGRTRAWTRCCRHFILGWTWTGC